MMENLRRKVEAVMRSQPGQKGLGLLGWVLLAVSLAYGLVMRLRAFLYSTGIFRTARPACQVISVGNITVGGAGKTPMTIFLARLLQEWGVAAAVASRGYGGSLQKSGGVVSDGSRILLTPREAGDEPCLLAAKLPGTPVVVGRSRAASAELCVKRFGTQTLILDDAFSHLAVARDVDLLLLDSRAPFGNGRVFPRGVLREPADHVSRADAVILTRAGGQGVPASLPKGLPVFACTHHPVGLWEHAKPAAQPPLPTGFLKGKRVFAFSGIADNDGFFQTLESLGARLAGSLSFPDHRLYKEEDRRAILDAALQCQAQCLVTTEKDLARLEKWNTEGMALYALEITILFEDQEALAAFIKSRLETKIP